MSTMHTPLPYPDTAAATREHAGTAPPEEQDAGRALVWTGGSNFDLVELDVPSPGAGELLVRVSTAAICGSDRHTVSGLREAPCPSILGHEGVGTIIAIGETGPGSSRATDVAGSALSLGDRIVWSVVSACGMCDRCRAGHTAKCRSLRKAGHESYDGDWPLSGSYATHVLLPARHHVVRVDTEISDGAAAISACAGATVMAALDVAPTSDLTGQRVLVSGVGMLGLLAIIAARAAGATDIRAIDPFPDRRALAERAGARTAATPSSESVGPVDLALEFSGSPESVATVIDSLDVGATAVLVGSVSPGPAVALDPEQLVRSRRTVTGVHNYEPQHLAAAVALLETAPAKILTDPMVLSTPIALNGASAAFSSQPAHLRTLINP